MIPGHILDKTWLEGNFLIPADQGIRIELRQMLDVCSHTGVMYLDGGEKARTVVQARLAALEAYDTALAKGKRKYVK